MENNPNASKIAEQNNTANSYWMAMLQSNEENPSPLDQASVALFNFASPLLEKATVKSVADTEHSALYYATCIYVRADDLVNTQKNPVLTNHLVQASLLLALQESCFSSSTWSYGSQLLFEMKRANIKLNRLVIASFLAQEGDWTSNRSKGDLLNGNLAAVGLYCARLQVLCQTLIGTNATLGGTEEALEKIEVQKPMNSPEEIIGFYLTEFATTYLQSVGVNDAQAQINAFRKYLAQQSDFYVAPCSTKYHLSREGGLAEHTIHVMMQMLWLTLPATKQQLGACVLAAIGHDLCKIGVYQKNTKSKKFYLTEGQPAPEGANVKSDQNGSFYWGEDFYYEFKDTMPFGHGRKSAYMLMSFFPQIGEEVYSAVDGHMGDSSANPNFMFQFAENPLALNLHIADVLATYIDEAAN